MYNSILNTCVIFYVRKLKIHQGTCSCTLILPCSIKNNLICKEDYYDTNDTMKISFKK